MPTVSAHTEKAVNILWAKKWLQDLNAFKLSISRKEIIWVKKSEAKVGTIIKSPHPYVDVFFPWVFWQRPHISEHNCLRGVLSMLGFWQVLVVSQDLLAWFCLCSRG